LLLGIVSSFLRLLPPVSASPRNRGKSNFKLKAGEAIKLHVYNIGNLDHSFHAHEVPHVSLAVLQGRPWPGNVVPLLSGTVDTLLLEFRHPGLWLFHCHVVLHADEGMIGVFIVEP
jgi:FtsP/CotA-like multicopper oxidase with cupredoxin domain